MSCFRFSFAFLAGIFIFTVPAHSAVVTFSVKADVEVFVKPNYNSTVVEKLTKGSMIVLKTDKVVGPNGIGVFYKVKTPQGKIGYVVDTDIKIPADAKPYVAKKSAPVVPPVAPPPVSALAPSVAALVDTGEDPVTKIAAPPPPPASPSPPTRTSSDRKTRERDALGGTVGYANYTEEFEGRKWSAMQPFFGARWSGANRILGLKPDTGFVMAPNAPKFLSAAGASGTTKGFIFLGDFSLLYPHKVDNFTLYGGGGALAGYSSFSTKYNGVGKNSANVKVGVSATAGAAFDFQTGVARFDIRYFIERASYLGFFVTLQIYL